ncbi:MAG: hypothetical protein H0X41_05750 [Chitinophagaceae bacterium]|nr:hypothetical protein [Chitinophagaceae bacterium]
MKLIHYSVFAAALLAFSSCGKELSLELGDVNAVKEKQLEDLIVMKKFQLKAFYSDIPIDYVENDDTVKKETNLWPYVSNYLKDDYNFFQVNGSEVTISQNALKMPGLADSLLHKKYFVSKDDNGVYMEFLDYQYQPLKYDVSKVGTNYFLLSIRWKHGSTLYSRFEIIP